MSTVLIRHSKTEQFVIKRFSYINYTMGHVQLELCAIGIHSIIIANNLPVPTQFSHPI